MKDVVLIGGPNGAGKTRAARIAEGTATAAAACAALFMAAILPATAAAPTFTMDQAQVGHGAYDTHCARCHGAALDDGKFGPPLKGKVFSQHWAGKTVADYLGRVTKTMPPGMLGSVDPASLTNIVAFVLQANGIPAGKAPLPAEEAALAAMTLPASSGAPLAPAQTTASKAAPASSKSVDQLEMTDAPREVPALLKTLQPVTDAMLRAPADDDWLSWRRTYDGHGFSPLRQITPRNAKSLGLAWSWSLAPGSVESTPLIHDGIMFIQSGMDVVQALDAATGDLLWTYTRTPNPADILPAKVRVKRNMAIFGTAIYAATSDAHMVALDARSGQVLWDRLVADPKQDWTLTGGPIIAKGKVIQGVASGFERGGGAIVALDAATGKELWRFKTVAGPGEPGGDTWNDLPADKRAGASVWVAGSYDLQLNLVYFGTGNFYGVDLVARKARPDANNDLLYTNTTLALDPDTGKLAWYFQHMPNDVLDLDWAFERTLATINGRKLVITGGKLGIFDALDAATGKFVFARDLGLQNIVAAIDPDTGAKTLNPAVFPEDGRQRLTCPSDYGARNWMATSFDAARTLLYIPLEQTCQHQDGLPSITAPVVPADASAGKFGDLAALDVATGKILWRERVRHAQSSGIVATAGGVLFNTDVDRWLRANDAQTGAELWKARLNDAANAFVVTYAVKGRQYVAIAAGGPKITMGLFARLTPEVKLPPASAPVMWVFALPQ